MQSRCSRVFKLARVFVAVLSATVSPSFAIDPFQLPEQQRHNEPRQPDEVGRPDAGPIGGADIREHRDKINSVKAQVFKSGNTPPGVTFRAAVNNGEAKAGSYVAEARFGDFSPQVKQQVAKQLGNEPRSDQRVAVLVDVHSDAVSVANARLSGASVVAPSQSIKDPGAVTQPAIRTPADPSHARTDHVRPARPALTRTDSKDASPAAAPALAGPDARQNAAVTKADAARPAMSASMPLPMTVRTAAAALVGDRKVTLSANTINLEPAAIIPTPSGRDLSVRAKDASGGMVRVELSGRTGDIPAVLKAQIQADLGQSALPAHADAPVTVTIDVMPDKSLRAVETRVEDVPALSQTSGDAPRKAAPAANNAGAQPAAQPSGAVQNSAQPVTASPSAAATSPFPAVNAAQTLALLSGLSPSSVRLQAPREEKAVAVSVPVQGGREIRVEAVRSEERGVLPTIHAEGRLGDFSPQTRTQVQDVLGQFKAASLVNEKSDVTLEAKPPQGDKVEITAIAAKVAETGNAKSVLMWREAGDEPVTAPESAELSAKPESQGGAAVKPSALAPLVAQNVAVNAPAGRPRGLVPAVRSLAMKAFGLPEGGYEIKQMDNRGNLKIDPVAAGKPSIPFNYRVDADGRHNFDTAGKPVDFTDTIREQVYEKLRAAVENGESWASEVMKGGRHVKVEFVVDEREGEANLVKVKSVTPTARDAAVDSAREMGLSDGDFFVVNLGQQALIVLEQGKTASVRIGDGMFNIVSPDGNAKIFVRPARTKKDRSAVFMLSKDSLKANRMTLIRAGGAAAAAAIKAALDANPNASEYIVNLDLAADEKIAIRAMMSGQSLNGPALEDTKKKPDAGE